MYSLIQFSVKCGQCKYRVSLFRWCDECGLTEWKQVGFFPTAKTNDFIVLPPLVNFCIASHNFFTNHNSSCMLSQSSPQHYIFHPQTSERFILTALEHAGEISRLMFLTPMVFFPPVLLCFRDFDSLSKENVYENNRLVSIAFR